MVRGKSKGKKGTGEEAKDVLRGAFIVLEGIDGCGKTTQAGLLAAWLGEQGYDVVLTRQPGGTPEGEQLRALVLSPEHEITPEAELFLYLADRSLHVTQVIRPALAGGRVVVCERYTDSTLAYQGYGRGLEVGLLRRLNEMATGGLRPDLTIVLDIPAGAARLDEARLDRLESSGDGFRERVACGFRALAAEAPERIVVIDGLQDLETVQTQLAARVAERLARVRPGEGS